MFSVGQLWSSPTDFATLHRCEVCILHDGTALAVTGDVTGTKHTVTRFRVEPMLAVGQRIMCREGPLLHEYNVNCVMQQGKLEATPGFKFAGAVLFRGRLCVIDVG